MTEEQWETKDQRAGTKTTFYERDIQSLNASPQRKKQLKRMSRLQEGEQVDVDEFDSRGTQNHKEDKRRFVGSFCSQLDMADSQKSRVEHLIMDVVSVNSFGNYSSEQVILAVINVVARENGRWIEDEGKYREFMESVGITNEHGNACLKTMRRLRALVRERVPSKSA